MQRTRVWVHEIVRNHPNPYVEVRWAQGRRFAKVPIDEITRGIAESALQPESRGKKGPLVMLPWPLRGFD